MSRTSTLKSGEDGEQGPPPLSDAVMAAVVGVALHLHEAEW